MTELPERLQEMNISDFIEPLRKQQSSPNFEVIDWEVKRIQHESIISTTGGLFLVHGQGKDGLGTRDWSLALKVISRPPGWCLEPTDWCYWKRELMANTSGMLQNLPQGISSPSSYGTVEFEDSAWIWMEYIVEATERIWSMEHFGKAAHLAGQTAGAYLTTTTVPDYPWFPRFFSSIYAEEGWWATIMNPDSNESAWNNDLVKQYFPEPLRSKILGIWQERKRFYEVMDRLPQVLCHNDFHRRNLMFQQIAEDTQILIAVDWAFVGRGAIGSDMGELIASSMYFNEVDSTHAAELEATVMESYLAGLKDAGWQGDARLPRLGYLLAASLWMGASLPGWTVYAQQEKVNPIALYGCSLDEIISKWVTLSEFLMTRTDEARELFDLVL